MYRPIICSSSCWKKSDRWSGLKCGNDIVSGQHAELKAQSNPHPPREWWQGDAIGCQVL